MEDVTNHHFTQWLLWDLPANTKKIPNHFSTTSPATTGRTNYDFYGYRAPCPPPGETDHYIFHLYALNTYLHLPAEADRAAVERAMKWHILSHSQLKTSFKR
jgi:hypothetical protein